MTRNSTFLELNNINFLCTAVICVGMGIPIAKHLELQRAGFLFSQSLGTMHILLFLCSSAFCCGFVTLVPVRKEKSKHFGNSAWQPEVGAVICAVGICCCWGQALCGGLCTWQVPVIFLLNCCRQQERKARFPEAKRFVSLPFSFAAAAEPARGWNCEEVRCDRENVTSCSFFMCLLDVSGST